MLRRLTVKNLAIVEDLELELAEGLTVITGETGAGKSILVDALALLAGGRGSSDLVRQGASRLVVAGEFDSDADVRERLAEAGLPGGETALMRRELSADGEGRAFVEDEPASVRTLARVGERLVAIQGQNSEQELADAGARPRAARRLRRGRRGARPRGGGRGRLARGVAKRSRPSRPPGATARARLETLDSRSARSRRRRRTSRTSQELPAERDRLLHADRIRRAGEAALEALSEGEGSAADRLGEAARAFAELAAIDPREEAHRAGGGGPQAPDRGSRRAGSRRRRRRSRATPIA